MINLSLVLSGKPILLTKDVYFHQPTIQQIVDMGEGNYWSALNVWTLTRKQIIAQETEFTQGLDDFEVWKEMIFASPEIKRTIAMACLIFLKKKIEFFDISHTMYIGEKESGVILDNTFYLLIRDVCFRLLPDNGASASEQNAQYRETDNMSERERQLIEKMKLGEKKLEETKRSADGLRPEDYFGNKILGLVAVGHYTFEQVYNMTMLQFNMLLKKYVDIQSFELKTVLSPYMSSEDGQTNKFWLD